MSDYVSFIHKSASIINKKFFTPSIPAFLSTLRGLLWPAVILFVILLLLSKKNTPTTKGFMNAVYGRLVPREIAKVFDNAD